MSFVRTFKKLLKYLLKFKLDSQPNASEAFFIVLPVSPHVNSKDDKNRIGINLMSAFLITNVLMAYYWSVSDLT